MPNLTEPMLLAFRDELHKEAAGFGDMVRQYAPRLKNVGTLGGVGALAGAVGGGGLGALHSFREAREEGAGTGGAALHALGGVTHGALRGAGLGALAGGIGGALVRGDVSGLAQRGGPVGAGARFGQRQVHALTGMLSPSELEGVRDGAFDAKRHLAQAADRAVDANAPWNAAGEKAQQAYTRASRAYDASRAAQDMGLTSVPGYLGAVKEHGLTKVLSTSAQEQFRNSSPALATMMVGLPAAQAVGTLASKEHPQGAGKGEELGRNIGGVVGGIAGGMMPLAGQVMMGSAAGHAGKLIGRGVDRLRGRPAIPSLGQPSNLEPTEAQHVPSERITSPAAAGQAPDIGL